MVMVFSIMYPVIIGGKKESILYRYAQDYRRYKSDPKR
jgi:hypothetical protein